MAKVFGMHAVELKPGVTEDEIETFWTNELLVQWVTPGERIFLLKGIKGERNGHYLAIHEFDSRATYERYFPPDGGVDPAYWATIEPVFTKLQTLAAIPDPRFTDYLVVSEGPIGWENTGK